MCTGRVTPYVTTISLNDVQLCILSTFITSGQKQKLRLMVKKGNSVHKLAHFLSTSHLRQEIWMLSLTLI